MGTIIGAMCARPGNYMLTRPLHLAQLHNFITAISFLCRRFVMVARDAATGTKSAPINPLKTETPEERFLFSLGEKNIALRAKMDQDALFKEPPS